MKITVFPAQLKGRLNAIASKSYAHRALIAAMLSDGETKILNTVLSDDIVTTANCLKALGCAVEINPTCISVKPPAHFNRNPKLWLAESGSTYRFMLPVCAALGLDCEFDGEKRLGIRPINALKTALEKRNVALSGSGFPLYMSGKLSGGQIDIDGSVSSQFISGLLLALPLLEKGSKICVHGQMVSKDYISITLDVLKQFGVYIREQSGCFEIIGAPNYCSLRKYIVENDWSNAAFFITAGVLSGSVEICGLNTLSVQGDKVLVDILKTMGADINITETALYAKKSQLKAVNVSITDCPDLAPVLAVAAANADGQSKICGISRLRDKESDRVESIVQLLKAAGIDIYAENDALYITGGKPHAFCAYGANDHRIVMSAAVLALTADGECLIRGAEAVNKSYPAFFEDYNNLGGKAYAKPLQQS